MGVWQGELELHEALENLDRMPKQKEFLSSWQPRAVYVGGQGSGKSSSLCTSAILNAASEPNGFSLIGRLNIPALESSTMRTFLELVPESYGSWADTKKSFTFTNGHEVIFKHLDITDPKTVGHIKSMNLSAAYVDELTEISEEVYFLILGRLRRKTAKRHIFRGASNPSGHDWVWRHFFDPHRKEELKDLNLGITASSMENPFLPPEYVQNMLNTYPPDWAERFIYGSFADFSDLVYKEFSEQSHVWDYLKSWKVFGDSGEPPESWPVIVGIDIGSDIDPWAIAIISVAPDGRLYQYEEVYGNNLRIAPIAEELKMKIGNRQVDGIAYDYANRQAALELGEHDIAGQPAIKEVRPGLFKMAQYMHVDKRLVHPFTAMEGSPRLFFSSKCEHAIREYSAYKWAKDSAGNPYDEPEGSNRNRRAVKHDNSHSPDSGRYAIHTFRPVPGRPRELKKWENPALDPLSRQFWQNEEKFRDPMERFQPKDKTLKTMKEWEKEIQRQGKRFQRPNFSTYRRF